jgi:hypothetical protein
MAVCIGTLGQGSLGAGEAQTVTARQNRHGCGSFAFDRSGGQKMSSKGRASILAEHWTRRQTEESGTRSVASKGGCAAMDMESILISTYYKQAERK